jgi:transposase
MSIRDHELHAPQAATGQLTQKLRPGRFCLGSPYFHAQNLAATTLCHIFADGGYACPKLGDALKAIGRWTVQNVKRSDTADGFEVLPRRWVVERTLT